MKTLLIILAIAGGGIFFAARSYQSPATTEVDILRDVTDTHLSQPDSAGVLRLLGVTDENKWNGAVFKFSDLSDVSFNRIYETKVDAANEWFGNELSRDKDRKAFQNEVSKILADSQKDSVGKRNSSVYIPIAHALNLLSRSKAQKRLLLVYSDLMENDSQLSFYKKKGLELLQFNPDSLKKILQGWQGLPDSLNGIEVYLIYQPSDTEQDGKFRLTSGFYKSMLEEKGATVTISANL